MRFTTTLPKKMNQSETFPEIDLNQWEERVKKELKTPHTFESLQWQVSEFFSLNPVYDEKVFENENLEYLHAVVIFLPGYCRLFV